MEMNMKRIIILGAGVFAFAAATFAFIAGETLVGSLAGLSGALVVVSAILQEGKS